jgi:hypothetical protein
MPPQYPGNQRSLSFFKAVSVVENDPKLVCYTAPATLSAITTYFLWLQGLVVFQISFLTFW